MDSGTRLLHNVVDKYNEVVKTRGHSVRLDVFNNIVKDLLKDSTGTEFFNKMTIILGGPTMPVTVTDNDGKTLFVLPAIYDGSETLNFSDTLLSVNKKREEHMQGSGKPIKDIIGLPNTSNREKWGLYLSYVRKDMEEATPKQVETSNEAEAEDDAEIED